MGMYNDGSKLKLSNLLCFIDHNGSQSFGITRETHPSFYPIASKIRSFGWNCIEVNGHNPKELGIKKLKNKPNMMIQYLHYRSPNKDEQ